MYKIYCSDSLISIGSSRDSVPVGTQADDHIIMPYSGKKKSLYHIIDLLEKTKDKIYHVHLYSKDVEALWENFSSIFTLVKAGGGVVINSRGHLAVIFRRGFWDLPKGKLDKNEGFKEAALREVEEETGLSGLSIRGDAGVIYHMYREKGKRILKETRWYMMACSDQPMVPQEEEGIEQAAWVRPAEFIENYAPIYRSLKDLLYGIFLGGNGKHAIE